MTLLNDSPVFRRYGDPGTDDDGFEPPDWTIERDGHPKYGGRGEWLYVFWPATDEAPALVDAFRSNEHHVAMMRKALSR